MQLTNNVRKWRDDMEQRSRDELYEIVKKQDKDIYMQAKRIEWVFANKLDHLHWANGEPITERPLTKRELVLLIDPPFEEDKQMTEYGISMEDQRQIHIASDPVLWAKTFLDAHPRAYQILIMRDPTTRKVFRCGRRLGKTWTMSVLILHYAFTTDKGRCLVMAPMKAQVGLIYEEILNLYKDTVVEQAVVRSVSSPQYELRLSNDSTVRLFTTGMKSGSKSDVARGQEAHFIVLDEMDYMGSEDLDALYAMLQQTDENQPRKQLIGASTPTGRRERFYEWCVGSESRFKEFYFPSYVNPFFDKELEEEMRSIYSQSAYRHEIEADWGEDAEGVYPRKYVEKARQKDYRYRDYRTNKAAAYVMGVDWDKYGAGPNICVLEIIPPTESGEFSDSAGKVRIAHREEIPRDEFVLTKAVDRIIQLNNNFNLKHIYVDRGYGDNQVELLHQYGMKNPETKLRRTVKGVSFAETIEVRDPANKEIVKKRMKPFMVDSFRGLLEEEEFLFSYSDEELYLELISYIVSRTTASGRPVFEASGSQTDHAHDALILAVLAYTQNYSDLLSSTYVRKSLTVNGSFIDQFEPDSGRADELVQKASKDSPKKQYRRKMTRANLRSNNRIHRRKF